MDTGEQWIRVVRSSCTAARLWFDHKDTSEQREGRREVGKEDVKRTNGFCFREMLVFIISYVRAPITKDKKA